ncbi:MAG: hypothetical protein IJH80_09965 [Ruminococcus sp.]|nr:hypothetical protein [Ruminococcus sp.]
MLIYANTLMEELATYLMFGCIAAAWLVTFITDKIFGLGFYPWVSTVLGSLAGIWLLFLLPVDMLSISLFASGGVSLISTIVQEIALKAKPDKPSENTAQTNPAPQAAPQQQAVPDERTCPDCAGKLRGDAKFCTYCGATLPPLAAAMPFTPEQASVPAAEEAPKPKDGSKLGIIVLIIAIVGILFNALTVAEQFTNSEKKAFEKYNVTKEEFFSSHPHDGVDNDYFNEWMSLDRIDMDMTNFYTPLTAVFGLAACVLILIFRRKLLSLAYYVPAAVILGMYLAYEKDKVGSVLQADYFYAALAAAGVIILLTVLYQFIDKNIIGIAAIVLSIGFVALMYFGLEKNRIDEYSVIIWCDMFGAAVLTQLTAVYRRRKRLHEDE